MQGCDIKTPCSVKMYDFYLYNNCVDQFLPRDAIQAWS